MGIKGTIADLNKRQHLEQKYRKLIENWKTRHGLGRSIRMEAQNELIDIMVKAETNNAQ